MFAGAGVSVPSGLPSFDELRDEALEDLRLTEYLDGGDKRFVTEAIQPEAFISALHRVGVDVVAWFGSSFGAAGPSLGHHCLAALARTGASVWTTNFDELIEQAGGVTESVDVVAWPEDPTSSATLLKPHGTLSGRIIATSEQVLLPLNDAWASAFLGAAGGKTVVIIGYSGRDLDFHPLWLDALPRAAEVVWFDVPGADRSVSERLMEESCADGRGTFVLGDPQADLVQWCFERGHLDTRDLAAIRAPFVNRYRDRRQHLPFDRIVAGGLAEVFGDTQSATSSYLRNLHRSPLRSIKRVANLRLNHGGRWTGRLLRAARPLVGAAGATDLGDRLRQKELNICTNIGDTDAVLTGTAGYRQESSPAFGALRAAALRVAGDLEEASTVAEESFRWARRDGHPVLTAYAGFLYAHALVWADRNDEALDFLRGDYELIAAASSARWVSWSTFLVGLATLRSDADEAHRALSRARERFVAEGLLDGAVSSQHALVVACRARADIDAATEALRDLRALHERRGVFYLRGSTRLRRWMLIEQAEIDRALGAVDTAAAAYRDVAASDCPVQAALGHLGLACLAGPEGHRDHATAADRIARSVHAGYQVERAQLLLERQPGATAPLLFA